MSDKLKLSDPQGDAELEKIASALKVSDLRERVAQLELSAARLKQLIPLPGSAIPNKPSPSNKLGARKHAGFKAISTAPSINLTPRGSSMVPVAYPTVQDLSTSVGVASTVNFNDCPVYLLDASTQPQCKGDEAGTGRGVRSGTVNGEVKPVKGSSTVCVEGKQVIRDGDPCTMNGGNNPGVYVTKPSPNAQSPKNAPTSSNPAFVESATEVTGNLAEFAKNPLVHDSIIFGQIVVHQLSKELLAQPSAGHNLATFGKPVLRNPQQRLESSLEIALYGFFASPKIPRRAFKDSEKSIAAGSNVDAMKVNVAWTMSEIPQRKVLSSKPSSTQTPTAKSGTSNGVLILGNSLASEFHQQTTLKNPACWVKDYEKEISVNSTGRYAQAYDIDGAAHDYEFEVKYKIYVRVKSNTRLTVELRVKPQLVVADEESELTTQQKKAVLSKIKETAVTGLHSHWNGKFVCEITDPECGIRVLPIVYRIVWVDSDQHFTMNIHKTYKREGVTGLVINVSENTTQWTYAHEFGHCLGLPDEYSYERGPDETVKYYMPNGKLDAAIVAPFDGKDPDASDATLMAAQNCIRVMPRHAWNIAIETQELLTKKLGREITCKII